MELDFVFTAAQYRAVTLVVFVLLAAHIAHAIYYALRVQRLSAHLHTWNHRLNMLKMQDDWRQGSVCRRQLHRIHMDIKDTLRKEEL